MVIHLLLAIVITFQIFLLVNSNATYSMTIMRRLYILFFDEEMEQTGVDLKRERFFFHVSEVRDQINSIVDNYFAMEDMDSIERYELIREKDENGNEIVTPIITSNFFLRKEDRDPWKDLPVNFTQSERGIFQVENDIPVYSDDDLRRFFSSMTNFDLQLMVRHNIPTTKMTTFD